MKSRRIRTAVCLTLLLSGCNGMEGSMDVVRPANQVINTENTETEQSQITVEPYIVQRTDRSVTEGNLECKIYYDQVILDGTSDAAAKINSSIENEMNRWLDEAQWYAESYLPEQRYSDDLFNFAELASVYNSKDYLSVHLKTARFMGGTASSDPYAYTYSKKTGELIPITQLLNKSIPEIDTIYSQKCAENGLNYNYTNYVVGGDYKYYISEEGDVIIYFTTYEVAEGAAGAFEFNIGNLNELTGDSSAEENVNSTIIEQPMTGVIGEFKAAYNTVPVRSEPNDGAEEVRTLSNQDRNPIYEMQFNGLDLWIRVGDGEWVNADGVSADGEYRFYDYDSQFPQMDGSDFKGIYIDKDTYDWNVYGINIIPVYYRDKSQIVTTSYTFPYGNNCGLRIKVTDYSNSRSISGMYMAYIIAEATSANKTVLELTVNDSVSSITINPK